MMQDKNPSFFQRVEGTWLFLWSRKPGRGYPFQKIAMIEYGEVKSKLGNELEIYAEKQRKFLSSGSKAMCDTTLVFIFVALVGVFYAAMLLPIYQNMEVHL